MAERDAIIAESELEISALYRPLTAAVRESVKRHADNRMTAFARIQIMRDVDAALDRVFGRFPGDPASPLANLVARRARQGWATVFSDQAAQVARRLRGQPEVLAAIRQDA